MAQRNSIEIDLIRSRQHQESLRRLFATYEQWGYSPFLIPIIDDYYGYEKYLQSVIGQKSFRFTNKDGDLVLLRSDLTLFLARHIAHSLSGANLPLRVWYADDVIRSLRAQQAVAAQQFQSGAELIGRADADAELEILLLAKHVVNTLGIENISIHIGSRRLYTILTKDIPTALHADLFTATQTRNYLSLPTLWREAGFTAPESKQICALFKYIGNEKQIPKITLKSPALNRAINAELKKMGALIKTLRQIDANCFALDMSEIGLQPYYTGMVFGIYAPSIKRVIASGGRYDDLFESFGFKATSVGFTVSQYRIAETLRDAKQSEPRIVDAKGDTFIARYQFANTQRKKGIRVRL